jgi:hypothetical protein
MSGWGEVKFDRFQFDKRARVISAKSGIAFGDYERMHVYKRKAKQVRRLPSPEWAQSKEGIRAVVLNYLERRYYIRTHQGTDQERIERIEKAAKSYIPSLRINLGRQMARYQTMVEHGQTRAAEGVAIQVQNIDKQISTIERGIVAIVTAVAYSYHCLGWDSPTVAQEFGLNPPNVRILLKRLNDLTPQLVEGRLPEKVLKSRPYRPAAPERRYFWNGERLKELFALRVRGVSLTKCAQIFGVGYMSVWKAWEQCFGPLRYKRPLKVHIPRCRRIWTGERLKELFALRSRGVPLVKCAQIFGVGYGTVGKVWRANFGPLRYKRPKSKVAPTTKVPRWNMETLEPLYRMRDVERKKFAEIAVAMGLKRCQDANRIYWTYLKSYRASKRQRAVA